MLPRVLVVDDNEQWTRAACRALTASAFSVTVTFSLLDATYVVQTVQDGEGFAVVLLDLFLGDGMGTDLLPLIARLRPQPRVALISGYLDGDRAVDLHGKCEVTICKPISNPKLVKLTKMLASSVAIEDWTTGFCHRYSLSERESAVLGFAAFGVQNKQIADRMACALSTVVSYWKRIFQKTGSRTKVEVLALFIQWQSRRRVACLSCPEWGHSNKLP